jgi:hypothetical protein
MMEFLDKVSPAWAFLQFPVVNWISPASAFRHQGQFQRMKKENKTFGWMEKNRKIKEKCEVEKRREREEESSKT